MTELKTFLLTMIEVLVVVYTLHHTFNDEN
jgi:hypothetical protein